MLSRDKSLQYKSLPLYKFPQYKVFIDEYADVSSNNLNADISNIKFINYTNEYIDVFLQRPPPDGTCKSNYLITLFPHSDQYSFEPLLVGDKLNIFINSDLISSIIIPDKWVRRVIIEPIKQQLQSIPIPGIISPKVNFNDK